MHKSIILENFDKEMIERAKKLNLDSIFLPAEGLTEQKTVEIKDSFERNILIYTIVEVFEGKNLQKEFHDAIPIDKDGKKIKIDNYFPVCTTHEGVRKKAEETIKSALSSGIDGLWLSNLRYPTKWDQKNPQILDTCYCDRCLAKFEEFIGESIEGKNMEEKYLHIDGSYYHEWLQFKSNQITSIAIDAKAEISKHDKDLKLGLFVVPWKEKEYGAGLQRIIAQDLEKLSDFIDELSPMLYYKRLGESVEWINGMVEFYWNAAMPFLPVIEAYEKISDDELKKAIEFATKSPSSGVCIKSWDAKLDIVKNSYLR